MTPDISYRSLIQIGLQIPRWRTKFRPCKCKAVSQAFIVHFKWYSLLHFAVCQLLCWAFLLWSISAITKIAFSDLDLLFKGQIFQMLISQKRWELSRKKWNMAFIDIDFVAVEWRHCEISAALLLIYVFKINISNVNISNTVRASAKKYDLHRIWYLPSNGTIANVVLSDLDLHFQGHGCK